MRIQKLFSQLVIGASVFAVLCLSHTTSVWGFDDGGFGVNPFMTVMPFGDSNTKGFHGDPLMRSAYRFELEKKFLAEDVAYDMVGEHQRKKDGNIDADHQGLGGYRIEQMTAEFGSAVEQYNPDFILVLAGTNNHNQDPDYDAFHQRYTDLLEMLTQASPDSEIVISTVPKFGYGRTDLAHWTDEWVDYRNNVVFPTMNSAIYSAADEFSQVSVVDLHSIVDVDTDLVEDKIHLNINGHEKLADLYYAKITAVPEPGSAGIVGLALVAFVARRRRNR